MTHERDPTPIGQYRTRVSVNLFLLPAESKTTVPVLGMPKKLPFGACKMMTMPNHRWLSHFQHTFAASLNPLWRSNGGNDVLLPAFFSCSHQ
jgi:hypothetical protein